MPLDAGVALSQDHIVVLKALAETFIQKLSPRETEALVRDEMPSTRDQELEIRGYCSRSGLDGGTLDATIDLLLHRTPKQKLQQLLQALALLSGRQGVLLTGTFELFSNLSIKQREKIVLGWASSFFAAKRGLFMGLRQLFVFSHYSCIPSPESGLARTNPNWAALEYPGPDPEAKGPRYSSKSFFDFTPHMIKVTAATKLPEFDAIVIGSGVGGGLMAARLSQAGFRVLVLEKGKYIHQRDLSLLEADGLKEMYEQGGLVSTSEGGVSILAGSTFGGGSTVNWCCSLRPPVAVREEWAEDFGVSHMLSRDFRDNTEAVCSRISVHNDDIQHNPQNQMVLDSCKRLGFPCKVAPQNTKGDHQCAHCWFGCKYGEKQGGIVTWLVDAAKTGNASFIDNCTVQRVTRKNGKATGVMAVVGSVNLRIQAKLVVVSAGSLNTPNILHRSRLTNQHIGKHLHIHPVMAMSGYFPGRKILSWKGQMMSTVCTVAENTEGDGYGAKIECLPAHAALGASTAPCFMLYFERKGGFDHKKWRLRAKNMAHLIVLTRDKDGGTVSEDADGNIVIEYRLSDRDKRSLQEGLRRCAQILIDSGAKELLLAQQSTPVFEVSNKGTQDPRLKSWLKDIVSSSVRAHDAGVFSAHQMSTARMASSPDTGAIQLTGETWECDNLFVADASAFPTASGVNPMVTNYALSEGFEEQANKLVKAVITGRMPMF